ncbi:hypothetical protein U9M48_001707 [Paspalum notatum var. saurae]|uniref:Integrase catalytic domain-containing protein n=1 Tax=Paspalum notatum var. saurae TaxID=547442 RepID=A0AAQ3PIP1_PASNO
MGVLASSPASAAAARPSAAGITAARPNGHRVDLNSRVDGFRVVTTLDHLPANGASSAPNSHPHFMGLDHSVLGARTYGRDSDSCRGKLPKLHFPRKRWPDHSAVPHSHGRIHIKPNDQVQLCRCLYHCLLGRRSGHPMQNASRPILPVDTLLKIAGQHYALIIVLVACASNVQRNGPRVIAVRKLFNCMQYKNYWNSFNLKMMLLQTPVNKTYQLETDACATGVGAVLLEQGHPLAYLSKALGPKSQGLSTYEKEYLDILLAVQQWRHYLQFQEFTIFTDQRSLVQLTDQRLHTLWEQKVFTKLLALQYKVVYKKGKENRVADALSRKTLHDSQCAAISVSSPQWVKEALLSSYEADEFATSLLTKLSIDPAAVPHFTLDNGVLHFKQLLWIGNNSSLRIKLMSACHDNVTYSRMKKLFAWPGMKSDVHRYVRGCSICQLSKSDRAKLPGLLQPLPVPDSAWQVISLDFVEGLPTSCGYNCILVVVDYFTKYGHFLPLCHPFTAVSVAKLFVQQVYRLHGLPLAIVSDRDRIFTSTFWLELFRLADVQLRMSSAYHPQSDRQTERLNQTMETFIRCFVNACPSKWYDWLPLAEFWYNSSDHSSIGRSPFQALYGYSPRHFGINSTDAIPSNGLDDWCREHAVMQALIKQQLGRSRLRMKRQDDKNLSEREFNVGDLVFLKLHPISKHHWHRVPTRSWHTSSLAPSEYWLALVRWRTSWSFLLPALFTLFFMCLS